jgi:MFS family permease
MGFDVSAKRANANSLWQAHCDFGRNAIGIILGLSAAIIAVGQIAGPMVAGVLADLTGDYRLGFTLLALLAAMGSVAFMLATKPLLPAPSQPSLCLVM